MRRHESHQKNDYNSHRGYADLYHALAYRFNNEFLIRQAFTRQSAINENSRHAAKQSYQSFEFLGDRILNLVIASELMDTFPSFHEGQLTDLYKNLIANEGVMPDIARKLGLEKYLIKGGSEIFVTEKMLADAMEALLGAIYLDCEDFQIVKKIICQLWQIPLLTSRLTVSYESIWRNKKPYRTGLAAFKEEQLRAHLQIPPELMLGNAVSNGGSFFDALAQALNHNQKDKYYTEESLRLECYKYYLSHKEQVDTWHQQDNGTIDYSLIQYTSQELKKIFPDILDIKVFQGRFHIEGKILCAQLEIPNIRIIKLLCTPEDNASEEVRINTITINSEGQSDIAYVADFDNRELPTLVIEQSGVHFVPILPKEHISDTLVLMEEIIKPLSNSRWSMGNGFENKLLDWSIEATSNHKFSVNPVSSSEDKKPLLSSYAGLKKRKEQYYGRFIPYLYEEVLAQLEKGIEEVNNKKNHYFHLNLTRIKKPSKSHNPYILTMEGKIPQQYNEMGRSALTLLLKGEPFNQSSERLILLAIADCNLEEDATESALLKVRCKLDEEEQGNINFFRYKWSAYILGSIISQQRMYIACRSKIPFSFEEQLFTGHLDSSQNESLSYNIDSNVSEQTQLNASQQEAIHKFLMLREGLQLLQGPPGTGKTTTIVTLLHTLYAQGHTILVCAPSNKAVHILAERYIQRFQKERVVFIGVEKKVPDALKEIYLQAWRFEYIKVIEFIKYLKKILTYSEIRVSEINVLLKSVTSIQNDIEKYIPELQYDWQAYLDNVKGLSYIFDSIRNNEIIKDEKIKRLLIKLIDKLESLASAIKVAGPKLEKHLLSCARLIFCTCVTSGREIMNIIANVDVLIIDEAGQAVEAETLIPFMFKPTKILLVGDTKQLPPTVLSKKAVANNFQWSMLWRLQEECRQDSSMLTIQYRMHPEIRQWPSKQFYKDKLTDADIITARPHSLLDQELFRHYLIFDVQGREEKEQHSFYNSKEIDYIEQLLKFLVYEQKINAARQIGIITFYKEQANHINELLYKYNIKASTVDGFQGEECDIIIISCVRANTKNDIGFIDDFRRLNVAITRARHHLFIFGDVATLNSRPSDMQDLLIDAKKRSLIYSEADFKAILRADKKHIKSLWPIFLFPGDFTFQKLQEQTRSAIFSKFCLIVPDEGSRWMLQRITDRIVDQGFSEPLPLTSTGCYKSRHAFHSYQYKQVKGQAMSIQKTEEEQFLYVENRMSNNNNHTGYKNHHINRPTSSQRTPLTDRFQSLHDSIAYKFTDTNNLNTALTRQSAINERITSTTQSYQRLEFLGDRVLNMVIAFKLVKGFPQSQAEQLHDKLKNLISKNEVLPAIGKKLALEKYLIRGRGEQAMVDKMYADAVKALLGAIFQDSRNDINEAASVINILWHEALQAQGVNISKSAEIMPTSKKRKMTMQDRVDTGSLEEKPTSKKQNTSKHSVSSINNNQNNNNQIYSYPSRDRFFPTSTILRNDAPKKGRDSTLRSQLRK